MREPRYVVLKVKDMLRHLDHNDYEAVMRAGRLIANGRTVDGKPPFNAAVVEQDWPEFEVVWALIEARMAGKPLITDAMVTAYLKANGDYWHENNLPAMPLRGAGKEAVKVSLEAAFAALVTQ